MAQPHQATTTLLGNTIGKVLDEALDVMILLDTQLLCTSVYGCNI